MHIESELVTLDRPRNDTAGADAADAAGVDGGDMAGRVAATGQGGGGDVVVLQTSPPARPLVAPQPQPSHPPRIIALINQKGGVGKTTSTVNLGAALAMMGRRVLLIDLDPQAHLTLHLGIDPATLELSNYDLLTDDDVSAADVVRQVKENLWVLPAEVNLAGAETELAPKMVDGRAQRVLRAKLAPLLAGAGMDGPGAGTASQGAGVKAPEHGINIGALGGGTRWGGGLRRRGSADFEPAGEVGAGENHDSTAENAAEPRSSTSELCSSGSEPRSRESEQCSQDGPNDAATASPAPLAPQFVLIDCPPSLGLLTINALNLAREVFVPMQAHFLALQGLSKLLETIGFIRGGFNPDIRVSGIILCMHEKQTILAGEVTADLEAFLEANRGAGLAWSDCRVLRPAIRRNIKLAESPSFGATIYEYAGDSNGAADYAALAEAVATMQVPGVVHR